MKISTNELELCFNEVLAKLREHNIVELNLETDYYQEIPTSQWDNFENSAIPDVGSLSDDIESLKKMINDSERPCTYVDFDRLVSVLRAISHEENPP